MLVAKLSSQGFNLVRFQKRTALRVVASAKNTEGARVMRTAAVRGASSEHGFDYDIFVIGGDLAEFARREWLQARVQKLDSVKCLTTQ